jgi:hypothetical protein
MNMLFSLSIVPHKVVPQLYYVKYGICVCVCVCVSFVTYHYSAIKENGTMSFSGKWMELEIVMLSEIS